MKYNIFYTDDDVDDREFFREVISEIGTHHSIYTQTDGEELMNALDNPPPNANLIFLDLNMPNMNGYEVLEQIRNKKLAQDIPIIVLSTSDDASAIQASRELGARMFITKPSSFTDFRKIMQSVLSIDWQEYHPEKKDFVFTIN